MDQHQRKKLSNSLSLVREEIALKMQLIDDCNSGKLQPESFGISVLELSEALASCCQQEEDLIAILESESKSSRVTRPPESQSLEQRLNRFCHGSLAQFLLDEECRQVVETFRQIVTNLDISIRFQPRRNDTEGAELTLVFPSGKEKSVCGEGYPGQVRTQASSVIEFLPDFAEYLAEGSMLEIIRKRLGQKSIQFPDTLVFLRIRRDHQLILDKIGQDFDVKRFYSDGFVSVEITLDNGRRIRGDPYLEYEQAKTDTMLRVCALFPEYHSELSEITRKMMQELGSSS